MLFDAGVGIVVVDALLVLRFHLPPGDFRVRLEPQKGWGGNDPEERSCGISGLEERSPSRGSGQEERRYSSSGPKERPMST